MRNDIDAICDDLLSRWHTWKSGYRLTRGYSDRDSTCRGSSSNWSAYDRDNGIADEWVEVAIMRGVDQAIDRIEGKHHLCILFEARNLASGAVVWSSERLPQGEELEVLRIESRTLLIKELQRDGIIGG